MVIRIELDLHVQYLWASEASLFNKIVKFKKQQQIGYLKWCSHITLFLRLLFSYFCYESLAWGDEHIA